MLFVSQQQYVGELNNLRHPLPRERVVVRALLVEEVCEAQVYRTFMFGNNCDVRVPRGHLNDLSALTFHP